MNKKTNEKLFLKFLLMLFLLFAFVFTTNSLSSDLNIQNQINAIISKDTITPNTAAVQGNKKNRFAFVLFYMGSCPHCQHFDPVLKQFSVNHNIPVLAYTLDGNSLPDFKNSFNPTKNELLKFFPTQSPVVPTLFLMDQSMHRIYPMMQGEATTDQLSARFQEVEARILNKNIVENNQQDFTS